MNALGSPVEALHVDYLSYRLSTAINNIWAWVAVITVAVGLWRIRGSSSPPRKITKVAALLTPSSSSAVEPAPAPTPAGRVNRHLSPAPPPTSCCETESEGSPKGKFSVYYYNDDMRLENDDGDGAAVEREELRWLWGDDWERTVAVRMGDMGWYKCLDLKVLDGSVVRLWE